MATVAPPKSILRFGIFELDTATGELHKNGIFLKLHPQPAKVLLLLASRPNQLVTREELKKGLWGKDTFVDFEQGLNSCIRQIRTALNDHPDTPRFVQTIPRQGYRFIAPVIAANGAAPAVAARPQVSRLAMRRGWWIATAILAIGVLAFYLTRMRTLGPAAPSGRITLAVLPFENISPAHDQEFIADGLTEEMIAQMGSLEPERLAVIARTSAMKYKGARVGVDQIGKELGVDYVIEGSIRAEGERMRVTAQLIRVKDQMHLWARNYERTRGGILAMQQEMASAIANEIQLKLTPEHQQRLAVRHFTEVRAEEAYARGRYFWNKRTDDDLATAIRYFEQAVQYEPQNPLPYSGLADAYFYRSYAFGNMPPREGMPKARAAASRALELDPQLAEAHTSMALVKLFYDWDWPGGETEFKRAIDLNPNYPTAHHGYAVLLLIVYSRWDDALAEAKRALELDPLSVPLNNIVALIYSRSPQHDKTIERSKRLLELNPNYATAYGYLSSAYEAKGLYQQAVDAAFKKRSMEGGSPQDLAKLAQAYANGGIAGFRKLEAEITIDQAKKQYPRSVLDRLILAAAYAKLGDTNSTLTILEKVCDERSGMAVWTRTNYADSPLRADPRFQDLLRRIGLPR